MIDYGVRFLLWVAAEPAVSILDCCLPVIFYLVRQGIVKLSMSKQSSGSNSSLKRKWPTSDNYCRQPSENSIELAQGGHTKAATSVGYTAEASKSSAINDDPSAGYDSAASVIRVQQDVNVRSHSDS